MSFQSAVDDAAPVNYDKNLCIHQKRTASEVRLARGGLICQAVLNL